MSELKPCPFCGQPPEADGRPGDELSSYFVFFIVCFCDGYSSCARKSEIGETLEIAQEKTAELWNRRAEVTT